jgi:CRISPR-associated protein Cmr2
MRNKWGIPWIDQDQKPKKYHPRLLNPGWLIEDAELPDLQRL